MALGLLAALAPALHLAPAAAATPCPVLPIWANTGNTATPELRRYGTDGTLLGALPAARGYSDIAINGDGSVLYGVVTVSLTLYVINPATGAEVSAISITGIPPGRQLNGLTVLPSGNLLAGTSDSMDLFVINPATGVATPYGAQLSSGTVLAGDLAVLPDGVTVAAETSVGDGTTYLTRLYPDTNNRIVVGAIPNTFGLAVSGGHLFGFSPDGTMWRLTTVPTTPSAAPLPVELVTNGGVVFFGAAAPLSLNCVAALPTPAISTSATPTAALGGSISDVATVTGDPNGPVPTGTVTFTVYGPGDPTCAGLPVATSTNPLGGGPPPRATSNTFGSLGAGTYQWVATYNGDANYAAVTSPCDAPGETSTISKGVPTVVTAATPTANLGQPISDNATVTGVASAPAPTGTVVFSAYGPDNANCGGAPVFTSPPQALAGSPAQATSTAFTPDLAGTYRWRAAYSGDANYEPLTSACNDTDESSVVTAPTISVEKSATPSSLPEPGGEFTFTVTVTNTSTEPLTLTSLSDDIHGDLDGAGTCATGGTIAPSATYSCKFSATFTGAGGATETDVVTAVATSSTNHVATDSDDATITVVDIPPQLLVTKTPVPPTLPAPGGQYVIQVTVFNNGGEAVTITDLSDSAFADPTDLIGNCVDAIGTVLEPGESFDCFFVATFTGPPGAVETDILTVTAIDDDGTTGSATDTATVRITAPAPTIDVTTSASPGSRPAPGGLFTFTVNVSNTGGSPVTLAALLDDVDGYLGGRGSCPITAAIPAGGLLTCSFTDEFDGDPGDFQVRTVRAIVNDAFGNSAIDNDDAIISLTGGTGGTGGAGVRAVGAGGPAEVGAGAGSGPGAGSGGGGAVVLVPAVPTVVAGSRSVAVGPANPSTPGVSAGPASAPAAALAASGGRLALTGTSTVSLAWPALAILAMGASLLTATHRRGTPRGDPESAPDY